MKSIIKIMSACALLVAAVNCYGAQQGQKITVSVTNQLASTEDETSVPLYGNVYETNAAGKVIEKGEKKYYTIKVGECLAFTRYKPTTLKNRATHYHRLIFATTKKALKDKVTKNKNSNEVESLAITQSAKKSQEAVNECYWITPSTGKKTLKIILSGSCSACATVADPNQAATINSIAD